MPKASGTPPSDRQSRRHNPLSEEYVPTGPHKQKAGKKRKSIRGEGEDGDYYIDSKPSQSILKISQDLVDEDKAERQEVQPNPAFSFSSRFPDDEDEDPQKFYEDDDEAWGDEDDIVEDVEIDPNDHDIFNKFHPSNIEDPATLFDPPPASSSNEQQGTNLADLILEKIAAHEASLAAAEGTAPPTDPNLPPLPTQDPDEPELSPKVVEVYTKVGQLLSRHRSGPLPKPFKILPTLPPAQIPALISLTNPDSWTPHAHYQSLRLFISGKPSIAQPYLTSILLPRVRDEIAETKKLHVHLYNALKKSFYKPACFFKGFLFPLLEDNTCTLREAQIISSVIARVSVPVLHSAAALLRLCDIAAAQFSTSKSDGGGGATNVFIRTLLEKKYALPYKVVDALVFHFMRFKALGSSDEDQTDDREGVATGSNSVSIDINMTGVGTAHKRNSKHFGGEGTSRLPVLWHQALLAFAQRYRNDITEDQREALLDLVVLIGHRAIGPEVRRELLAGRGRGVVAQEGIGDGGDDTMVFD